MKKTIKVTTMTIVLILGLFIVGCANDGNFYSQIEETGASTYAELDYKDAYNNKRYLELAYVLDNGYGGDYFDMHRFRPLFYNLPAPFADLVGRDVYHAWLLSRCAEERENENVAVSFIRYFNISRSDFERANEELRQIWSGIGASPEDSASFELYPVELIFTFDNDRINEFFRWENSPIISERTMGAGVETRIPNVAINITTPTTGAAIPELTDIERDGGNFWVESATWSSDTVPVATNTATAIISARTGYTLNGLTSATINGNPAAISHNTGITARISYTFIDDSGTPNITPMVSGGGTHTAVLKADGTVWSWGANDAGQLGDGTTTASHTPVQTQNLENVIAVTAGSGYTVALRHGGTVWSWGRNVRGQLGDGTTTNRYTPVQVQNLRDIISISAGAEFTTALRANGTVWSWGMNNDGQLGDGTTTARNIPVQVQNLANVIAISSGFNHAIALKEDGTVWTWGVNSRGQLGDGTTTNRHAPVQVQNLENVVAIAAGFTQTIALKNDGTVWAWGWNLSGQLGDGTNIDSNLPVQVQNLTNITAISSGMSHTVALRNDGTVWSWGHNANGRLGDGTTTTRNTPVQVRNLENVVAVSVGYDHTTALTSEGAVWAWGMNNRGQLGDGTTTHRFLPVRVLGSGGQGFLYLN